MTDLRKEEAVFPGVTAARAFLTSLDGVQS